MTLLNDVFYMTSIYKKVSSLVGNTVSLTFILLYTITKSLMTNSS